MADRKLSGSKLQTVEDHPQESVACFFSRLAQVTRSCQYNRVGVSPIPRKNPYSFSVVMRAQ
jgi:hypothetical protein